MIVIPMAGASSRFTAAGYREPKFKLPLHGRPVFDYCVASFGAFFTTESFLFVCRDDAAATFVQERVMSLGVRDSRVVSLDAVTGGQAETVEAGLRAAALDDDEPLTIFNIDTFRPGLSLALQDAKWRGAAGALEVFEGEGDNWSFVLPDPDAPGFTQRTAEKVPISNLCSTGLYEFRSAREFLSCVAAERKAPQAGETYVAPLYNHLIARGEKVGWKAIHPSEVIFCGVPAEYEALVAAKTPPFNVEAALEA